MTADLAHATPWGATHHHTDLGGDVHWIHWDAPEGGVDATPMVLVHGLGGSHTNWLEVGQMWSQHREVFALDLRGFGLTAGHPADTAVLANRDLVVAFLEHVVRRPAIVVGNSMGGMISTFVTRSRPDLVAGLVLVDPALPAVPVRPDPVVASRFAVFALPGVAEAGLRRARQTLPPRVLAEQVAALVCLGYANAEIAVRLSISLPTVKAHVRSILRKFSLSRRSELQHILSDWDFSAWQPEKILICGGCANIPGVADVISSRVGIAAERGDPLGQMKLSSRAKAQAVSRDATALLTACGLALRSFDD